MLELIGIVDFLILLFLLYFGELHPTLFMEAKLKETLVQQEMSTVQDNCVIDGFLLFDSLASIFFFGSHWHLYDCITFVEYQCHAVMSVNMANFAIVPYIPYD